MEACKAVHPDLVITDIKMPEMDGIEAAIELYRDHPLPVIQVSAYHDAELITRAEANHIMRYLIKPIRLLDLEVAIALAMRRFEEFQLLCQDAADRRQALENRKIVEADGP